MWTLTCSAQAPGSNSLFQNLHNFRDVGGSPLYNRHGQKLRDGLLFRSARTDFVAEEEADRFLQLGIKTIVDLRTKEEYSRATGRKVLGEHYAPYIGTVCKDRSRASCSQRQHFMSVMTREYGRAIYNRVNIFFRCFTPVLLLADWLFGSTLTVKMFSHLVLNQQSLAEWYMDILEYAKPQMAEILRLLLDDTNVPVLINCAHGKDRTGIIIALVLGCLEVDDDVIAKDYSLSEVRHYVVMLVFTPSLQAGLAPVRNRLVRESTERYGFKMEFTTATVDTMKNLLAEISRR
jgi:hypothetical protein